MEHDSDRDRREQIRVVVLRADRLLVEALQQTLTAREQVCLVLASMGAVSVDEVAARRPDVALIDGGRQPREALKTVRALRDALPALEIVAFGLSGRDEILDVIEAGASAYVSAEASLDDLISTVEAIHRGEAPSSTSVVAGVVRRLLDLAADVEPDAEPNPLSKRERSVLDQVARGLSNKEIADALGISPATVKNHVHRILAKLDVASRREAVARAYLRGWIDRCLPSSSEKEPVTFPSE